MPSLLLEPQRQDAISNAVSIMNSMITSIMPFFLNNLAIADSFQLVNDVAREDFLLLASTEDIPLSST